MSNVGYDLDPSGGLMPLIRALIKPPDEEVNTPKPKKPQHPYYKRPGKGHNHDSCDACGEGGDLICCDRCPASFHLGCYDPPLDENDIPVGLWLCRECRASDAEKPASSRSSRAQSPADSKSDTEKKTRTLRNNRSNSTKKKIKEEEEEEKEPEKQLTPMEILVKAAKIMNPTQFELPREMRIPCVFPGTDKEGSKNGNASLVTVDSSGCVPLPAKSCFVCQGTCKAAPLLQCDYCVLLFHQDCLDPPLTALPTGRWMCPNHVEQYIDWKLVNSISATERVALWEKFSGPVDQHAIKVDFIRRARNARPAFRVKVPVGVMGRVVVPAMVRHHYRHPPPLLPSRREHVRCTRVLQRVKECPEYSSSSEEETAPRTVCLNMSCPSYSGGGPCPRAGGPCPRAGGPCPRAGAPCPRAGAPCPRAGGPCPRAGAPCSQAGAGAGAALPPASRRDAHQDLNAINGLKDEKPSEESSDLSDSDFEYFTASVKKRKISPEGRALGKRGQKAEKLEFRPEGNAEELLAAVDEQLQKLDERLVKLLAWQRLQQVLAGSQAWGGWRYCPLPARAAAAARRAAAAVCRRRLARLGVRRLPLPSELLSRAERETIAARVWGPPPPAPPAARARHPPAPALAADVRAVLVELHPTRSGLGSEIGHPHPMCLSSMTIGTDSGCDVRLEHSSCRALSRHHAVIFMDEVTRHFELINYSEWGTRVNGVVYACDITHVEHPDEHGERAAERGERGERPDGAEPDETAARASAVRDIVRHRMANTNIRINGDLSSLTGVRQQSSCRCRPPAAAAAWEGSALLLHGALLQFGCLTYVFSITDASAFPYEQPVDDPAI